MSILPLLIFILPLGLDTLGVSISLGIKSRRGDTATVRGKGFQLPSWFFTAILFSIAETLMPLLGLAIGYATSLAMSHIMHIAGPLILIGIGVWELIEEGQEYFKKYKRSELNTIQQNIPAEKQF